MTRGEAATLKATSAGLSGLSRVAPSVAGRIATYLWFTPFPFARRRLSQIPPEARRVTFESDEVEVHGYEIGDGSKTALLIHGWAGSSRQYGRIARRLAEEGYRSVVIDLPGHGVESGRSTDVVEIVDAIEAVGGSLGKVDIVVAHSLGAMATSVAMQQSLEAERLVLVAPGLRPLHAVEKFAAQLRLRPAVQRAVIRSMERKFGSDVWDRIPDEIFEMQIPGSTLIIHDVDDDMVPVEQAQLLAENWSVGLVSTKGYGHNGVLRATEVIDRIAALATAEPLSA